MFHYTKLDLCELTARSDFEFPQVAAIWSRHQDDGFGNLIDTMQYDLRNPYYSPYICNFLGYDYTSYHLYFCNYGDH